MLPAALRPIQSEPFCSLKSIKIVEMRYLFLANSRRVSATRETATNYMLPHILILCTLRLFQEQTDKRLFTLLRSTHIP
jgi:hypothetical protein